MAEMLRCRNSRFYDPGRVGHENPYLGDVLCGQLFELNQDKPWRMADVIAQLNLKQIVITSVTRVDLPDGGASIFARTIELLRRQNTQVKVESLVPDFAGSYESLKIIFVELMHRNYATGCNIVTIGQYLRPSPLHLPVEKYYHQDEFQKPARIGMEIGFGHVEKAC